MFARYLPQDQFEALAEGLAVRHPVTHPPHLLPGPVAPSKALCTGYGVQERMSYMIVCCKAGNHAQGMVWQLLGRFRDSCGQGLKCLGLACNLLRLARGSEATPIMLEVHTT